MYEAKISLIPKGRQSLVECGNYRPISLLNSDVKIFAGVLTNGLDIVITSLVDPNQTNFIQGWQIYDNVWHFLLTEWVARIAVFL